MKEWNWIWYRYIISFTLFKILLHYIDYTFYTHLVWIYTQWLEPTNVNKRKSATRIDFFFHSKVLFLKIWDFTIKQFSMRNQIEDTSKSSNHTNKTIDVSMSSSKIWHLENVIIMIMRLKTAPLYDADWVLFQFSNYQLNLFSYVYLIKRRK